MTSRDRKNSRVVLYSGGQQRRNSAIHDSLLELALQRVPDRQHVRMTYLPFTLQGALPFFNRFERRYKRFGGTHFACVAADEPGIARPGDARRRACAQIAASDIVYLAGGNTFYFLAHLKRSGLFDALRKFAARGGIVAGLSAGALILTPSIALADYPSFDRDSNEVGLSPRRWNGLGLVGFEFFPHYRHSARYREALATYSLRRPRPVYACADGGGIVIARDRFTVLGDVWVFNAGRITKIGAS